MNFYWAVFAYAVVGVIASILTDLGDAAASAAIFFLWPYFLVMISIRIVYLLIVGTYKLSLEIFSATVELTKSIFR